MDGLDSESELVLHEEEESNIKDVDSSSVSDTTQTPTVAEDSRVNSNASPTGYDDRENPSSNGTLSRFIKGAKEKFDKLPPAWGQLRTNGDDS